MITFAPRFPAIWLETYARSDNFSRLICKLANVGLEYGPRPQDRGHSFSLYGPPGR